LIGAESHKRRDANSAVAGGAIGAVSGLLVGSLICYALQGEAEEPAPAPAPAPPPKPAPERIVLRGVNFDFDKATIRPDAKVILDEAANLLSKNGGTRVSVDGHTDAVGSDAYNQKLSERRANAVVQYLTGKGVAAASLSAKGYGESKAVSSNETKDGRAMNRRVELRVQ
jgi:OOP family OmpA-OmpF porin